MKSRNKSRPNLLTVILFSLAALSGSSSHARTLEVAQVDAYPELSKAFRTSDNGWVGGDGAYSIQLRKGLTLWTFGDSWIGKIENNHRLPDCQFINNAIAVQKISAPLAPLRFDWINKEKKATAVWRPENDDGYFWPGDGVILNGKLFVFLHKIRTDKSRLEPFQFRTVSDALVRVNNPCDKATDWKCTYADLANDAEKMEYGTATISDAQFVYIYCSNQAHKDGLNVHPATVCRISKDHFQKLDFKNLEFFAGRRGWVHDSSLASVVFADAAPEMSVTRVEGIPGLIAVYMPPLSKEIFIRHAVRPEGPWGPRIKIYECPEKDDQTLLYSAKAHQELAKVPGELIVTYCRNSKDNEVHYKDASIYFPQAVRVKLKARP